MHKPKCNIRRTCGDRRSPYQPMVSPDNPYLGGDYYANFRSFVPSDLVGPTLLQWVEADFITGLNNGDAVATWEDQTSNNNDFSQSTANRRPTYQTNVQNGKPAVRFATTNAQGMVSPLDFTPPFCIFIAYNYRSAVSAQRRAFVGTTLNWLIGPYSNKHQLFTGVAFIQGPAVVENQFVLACVQQTTPPNNVDFYINNSLIGSGTPATEPDNSGLGGSNPFGEPLDGDIIGMLAYGGLALTSDQITQVANYWNSKYSIY